MKKSFTLIEVLIGTSLILIVFLGIFGAYQMGLKVVGLSKNKIVATAIASGEIEKIRNLPYEKIGIINGILPTPVGILETTTAATLNNVEYKIEREIKYVIDSADGIGAEDSCNWDYKRVQIKVSWLGRFGGEVKLITDISPKDKVQEIQSCQAQPGGILSVTVFDAYGNLVSNPLVEIFNPSTGEKITQAIPSTGKYDFPLVASTYKVVVSKSGYSSGRTYGTNEIAIPEKPHPIVLESQITEISFSIDKLSSFSINTLSPWGQSFFSDSFSDESKISEKSNVVISGGQARLEMGEEGYPPSGYLISIEISPANLIKWHEFSFNDEEPTGTDLKCQIYYASGTDWILVPDSDLPGNSMGFGESPVDLSNLVASTYPKLKLRASFSTNSASSTPILNDYQVAWMISEPIPIPNVAFGLRGEKLIGYDANENPVYKFSITTTTNSSGHKELSNLEWDNYTFSVAPATGLNLVGTDPESQPIGLAPETNLAVKLYLKSENSLLVTVQDSETLEPVFSARVRLSNSGSGYDTTQYTNEKGQTFFMPLGAANYNLEISGPSYSNYSGTISVSGNTTKTIGLVRLE